MPLANRKIVYNAEVRRDPTRTTTLRREYQGKMYKRFREVKGLIRTTVDKNDALDMGDRRSPVVLAVGPVSRFDVTQESEKISEFMSWLRRVIDDKVLLVANREAGEILERERWQDAYVRAAYKKGLGNGLTELKRRGIDLLADMPQEWQGSGVESLFSHPMHADRVATLAQRNFTELQGITEAMDQQIARTLAEGMTRGDGPRTIARALNDRVDKIGITRARVMARTEVVKAHSDSVLNLYEQAGIDDVTVLAEHTVIHDDRLCEICAEMEGNIYTIKEARGIIPVHPNCRCSWLPVVD